MRKDLIRRLVRLETKLRPTRRWPSLLWVMGRREKSRRAQLTADERVVLDWYRCFRPDSGMFFARERIVTDPADQGRICPPGRCLEDVMREREEDCGRQADGSCGHCLPGEYPEGVKDLFPQMRWETDSDSPQAIPVVTINSVDSQIAADPQASGPITDTFI